MPTRRIRCLQCGAPKDTADDCLVVLCDYCGAFVAVASERFLDPAAAMSPDALARLLNPSEAEKRWQDLAAEMERCRTEAARDAWRLAAAEHYALLPLVHPEMVPERFRQGAGLAEYVRATVTSGELTAFDPEVVAASAAMSSLTTGLWEGDPLQAAREILDASLAFHRTLFGHPEFPVEFLQPDAERQAREYLRSLVNALVFQIGEPAIERIKVEVLGDRVGEVVCDGCGATVPDPSAGSCPFCGVRIAGASRSTRDPAMERVIGIFRATAMAVPDPDALAMTALTYLLTVGPEMGWTPTADTAVVFFDEGAPDLDRGAVVRAITTMGPHIATTDEGRALLALLAQRLGS